MFYLLPPEILDIIYSFDNTFKKNYDKVINDINYNYRYKYLLNYIKYINIIELKALISPKITPSPSITPSSISKRVKLYKIRIFNYDISNEIKNKHFLFDWIFSDMVNVTYFRISTTFEEYLINKFNLQIDLVDEYFKEIKIIDMEKLFEDLLFR